MTGPVLAGRPQRRAAGEEEQDADPIRLRGPDDLVIPGPAGRRIGRGIGGVEPARPIRRSGRRSQVLPAHRHPHGADAELAQRVQRADGIVLQAAGLGEQRQLARGGLGRRGRVQQGDRESGSRDRGDADDCEDQSCGEAHCDHQQIGAAGVATRAMRRAPRRSSGPGPSHPSGLVALGTPHRSRLIGRSATRSSRA